jgi:hypothetical protein
LRLPLERGTYMEGGRMSGKHRRTKGSRGNESPKTIHPKPSVTQRDRSAPDESPMWDGITPAELRDLIDRYGDMQIRFPAKVVAHLLDEIDRLEAKSR